MFKTNGLLHTKLKKNAILLFLLSRSSTPYTVRLHQCYTPYTRRRNTYCSRLGKNSCCLDHHNCQSHMVALRILPGAVIHVHVQEMQKMFKQAINSLILHQTDNLQQQKHGKTSKEKLRANKAVQSRNFLV